MLILEELTVRAGLLIGDFEFLDTPGPHMSGEIALSREPLEPKWLCPCTKVLVSDGILPLVSLFFLLFIVSL